MLNNHNLLALLPAAVDMWGISERSVNLVAMPLFHIGGSGWALVGMYVGAAERPPARPRSGRARPRLFSRRHHPRLRRPGRAAVHADGPGADKADYSSLENVVYGASPISDDVLRASIAKFGCAFLQAYGLTETTGGIVTCRRGPRPDGPNRHRLRSCGGRPGVEVRIVDAGDRRRRRPARCGRDPRARPAGHEGLLEQPEATAETITRTAGSARATPATSTRRLHLHPRPGEGHDHVRRREHLPGRGRERVDGPPGDRRRRGHRRARRAVGRDGQGDRRAQPASAARGPT